MQRMRASVARTAKTTREDSARDRRGSVARQRVKCTLAVLPGPGMARLMMSVVRKPQLLNLGIV